MEIYNIGDFNVPVYLIGTHNNWTIIEGGISYQTNSALTKLKKIVQDLDSVQNWIILHAHYDHYGLLPYLFSYFKNIKIWVGEKTFNKFKDLQKIHEDEDLNKKLSEVASYTLPKSTYYPVNEISYSILSEHKSYDFSKDLCFNVIKTPGHSSCSISIFEKNNGFLFVSDALGGFNKDKTIIPLFFQDIRLYLSSIQKIQEIDSSSILLGHKYPPFCTAKKTVDNSLNSTVKFIDNIKEKLKTVTKETLVEQLVNTYFHYDESFIIKSLYVKSFNRIVDLIHEY